MKLSKEVKGLAEWHEGQGHDSTAKFLHRAVPILEKHEAAQARRAAKAKQK